MSDIKINSNPAVSSHPEQFERDAARGGSFHGANVNAVPPPAESPLAGASQKLNASRISPPQDSPLADAKSGYRLSSTSQPVGETPTNDQLFNHAAGKSDSKLQSYLNQDAAASRAVAEIARGHREIGSPDREPKLDESAQLRLNELANRLFR